MKEGKKNIGYHKYRRYFGYLGYLGYIIILFAIAFSCFFGIRTEAASAEENGHVSRLSDSAGLLSTEEAVKVEEDLKRIPEWHQISIYLITTDKIGKKDSVSYIKEQRKKAEDKNLIICFISMKKKHIFCNVSAYGNAKENLSEKRVRKLSSALEEKIKQKRYLEGMELFCRDLLEDLEAAPVFDRLFFQPLFDFILCLLLTVVGMILYLGGFFGKRKEEPVPYYDKEHSILLESRDDFTHTSSKSLKQKKKQEEEFSDVL